MTDIDQTEVEMGNRKVALQCSKHKTQELVFFCMQCAECSCSVCYALFHNKHDYISVEEAGKQQKQMNY